MALSESIRSFSPKDGVYAMQDTKPEESTQPHTLTEKFIQSQEKIFKETSNPGDILDMSTGKIIRNHAHKAPHISSKTIYTNINDIAADEVEKEFAAIEARQKIEEKVDAGNRRPSLDFKNGLRRALSHATLIRG